MLKKKRLSIILSILILIVGNLISQAHAENQLVLENSWRIKFEFNVSLKGFERGMSSSGEREPFPFPLEELKRQRDSLLRPDTNEIYNFYVGNPSSLKYFPKEFVKRYKGIIDPNIIFVPIIDLTDSQQAVDKNIAATVASFNPKGISDKKPKNVAISKDKEFVSVAWFKKYSGGVMGSLFKKAESGSYDLVRTWEGCISSNNTVRSFVDVNGNGTYLWNSDEGDLIGATSSPEKGRTYRGVVVPGIGSNASFDLSGIVNGRVCWSYCKRGIFSSYLMFGWCGKDFKTIKEERIAKGKYSHISAKITPNGGIIMAFNPKIKRMFVCYKDKDDLWK